MKNKNKKTALILLFYGLFLLITTYYVITECLYLLSHTNEYHPLSSIKQAEAKSQEGNIPTLEPYQTHQNNLQDTKTLKAYITAYSAQDSCHYPTDDNLCLAANGLPILNNAAACPRFLPLGTKIQINNQIYVCQDRYSTYLDAERDLPTFDLWQGYGAKAHEQAVNFGIQQAEVIIIQ